jgi:hypothetical protein
MATVPNPDLSNPGEKRDSNDQGQLVQVAVAENDSEATIIQSLLESAGIQSLLSAEIGPQDVLPVGPVIIKVAPENADKARQVISEAQNVPDEDMLDESEANAGPTEIAS